MELTDRQTRILKALIEEYMETAVPVGSGALEKKYDLGVSPATVRNEMVRLTKSNFLKQPHTSAGRVPTKQAFRFYVDNLMEPKNLSVADEVAAREKIWDARFDFEKLLRQATRALAEKSKMLAVSALDQGEVYYAGSSHLLDLPEFFDIDVTRTILSLLDEDKSLLNLFSKSFGDNPIHFLFGDELGFDYLEPCGMVFTRFEAGKGRTGAVGVIGPNRLNFSFTAPLVRHFGQLIEELSQEPEK